MKNDKYYFDIYEQVIRFLTDINAHDALYNLETYVREDVLTPREVAEISVDHLKRLRRDIDIMNALPDMFKSFGVAGVSFDDHILKKIPSEVTEGLDEVIALFEKLLQS